MWVWRGLGEGILGSRDGYAQEDKMQSGKFEKAPARGLRELSNQNETRLETKLAGARSEVKSSCNSYAGFSLEVTSPRTPSSNNRQYLKCFPALLNELFGHTGRTQSIWVSWKGAWRITWEQASRSGVRYEGSCSACLPGTFRLYTHLLGRQ